MKTQIEKLHLTLPIFCLTQESQRIFYTPGHFTVARPGQVECLRAVWQNGSPPMDSEVARLAGWLIQQAEQAVHQRERWIEAPFQPECLTIYLSNQCQLNCIYCYSAMARETATTPPSSTYFFDAIRHAAQLVAHNCAAKQKAFYLVLHGGGEPTLHWEWVQAIAQLTRQVASQHHISWKSYLATNGIFSKTKAVWLARNFSRVGVSCDGPPQIHNKNRPSSRLGETALQVEQTIRTLQAEGCEVHIRTTLTPSSRDKQPEIAGYFLDTLQAKHIRFEPVYRVQPDGRGFESADAEPFAASFLQAQRLAAAAGGELTLSSVRLEELHAGYCQVLRDVLHLLPDGTIANCFLATSQQSHPVQQLGFYDASRGAIQLESHRIQAIKRACAALAPPCRECWNGFHCVQTCPEICRLELGKKAGGNCSQFLESEAARFSCRVAQEVAAAWVMEAARHCSPAPSRRSCSAPSEQEAVAGYLEEVPAAIDCRQLLENFNCLQPHYGLPERSLPPPPWSERPYDWNGGRTWEILKPTILAQGHREPISIYVHIPFCDRRCGFCDCLSEPLGKNVALKSRLFGRAMQAEIRGWTESAGLDLRPVTTVHFGGGTANCLKADLFQAIVEQIRTSFNVTPQTEWAIETTSSRMGCVQLDFLSALGFRRLHVGVQTLEDDVRRRIGRKEDSQTVLVKLEQAQRQGFVTSVDLIYGLPGQTMNGFAETLRQLTEIGLHGVSLYRLNRSERNRSFLAAHAAAEPNYPKEYVMFQMGEQWLRKAGYQKNHISHYSLPPDRNLYYTHALRREDLLALGPTADGVFRSICYRHAGIKQYLETPLKMAGWLEGGLRQTPLEKKRFPLQSALMCAHVPRESLEPFPLSRWKEHWLACAFLAEEPDKTFSLQANGSWFISQMISQLSSALA